MAVATLLPLLERQEGLCWMPQHPKPQPEKTPFVPAATGQSMNDPIVAAACDLMGVHWRTLERAGQVMDCICKHAGRPELASAAVSVLLAASFRETEPVDDVQEELTAKCTCLTAFYDPWLSRDCVSPSACLAIQRTVNAVYVLVTSDRQSLTNAARQVLRDEQTLWFMEVIKRAYRIADMTPGLTEKLIYNKREAQYGILSCLQGVEEADKLWLTGCWWPYTLDEKNYICELRGWMSLYRGSFANGVVQGPPPYHPGIMYDSLGSATQVCGA